MAEQREKSPQIDDDDVNVDEVGSYDSVQPAKLTCDAGAADDAS